MANASVSVSVAPSIPVGPTTIAGSSISSLAFVLAIIAALSGHSDAQTVEIIVAGAIGLATAAITLAGRYLQAHAAIKAAAAIQVANVHSPVQATTASPTASAFRPISPTDA